MAKTKAQLTEELKKLQQELEKAEKKERPKRYSWFTMVIYPREDETNSHGMVLAYIERMKILFDKYAYAEHDHDKFTEEDEKENPNHKAGEPKKIHTHVVFHVTEAITIKGMEKRLAHKCDSCIRACSDPRSAILYLTHETLECEVEGKYKYPHEIVKGSVELLKILEQNTNFVQKELADVIHEKRFLYDTQKYIFDTYSADTAEAMFTELYKSAYYGRMSDQELKRKKYYSDDEYQQWLSMLRAKKAKEEQNWIDTDTGEVEKWK